MPNKRLFGMPLLLLAVMLAFTLITCAYGAGESDDTEGGDTNGGAGGKSYPYLLTGDTLIWNPMQRGGYPPYTPKDTECDKWDLQPETRGVFPVGIWVSQDSSDYWTEKMEFSSDGVYRFYHASEGSYSRTGDSAGGTIDWFGWTLPYTQSGNTLVFNPMGRGNDLFVEFTPEDPQCDRWNLKPGTDGVFPIGEWVLQGSNSYYTEWVEFTSKATMINASEEKMKYSVDALKKTIELIRY